ncbi:MAG: hypothetical protein KF878_23135 [Planctomycetes bacterium]|nr:hypothetical protein [Planctomycetota bacterium]
MSRRHVSAALLASLALNGCATASSFPAAFGGMRLHARMSGLVKEEPYGRRTDPEPWAPWAGRGLSLVGFWDSLYWPLFPYSLTDLFLSLPADVAVLPFTLTHTFVSRAVESREAVPRPAPPPPPARTPHPVVERPRAPLPRGPQPMPALDAALKLAEARAPGEDSEARRLLSARQRAVTGAGGVHRVGYTVEVFYWLPEGSAADSPDVARFVGAQPDASIHPMETPLHAVRRAHVAERTGDLQGARALCDDLLAADPWRSLVWTIRGWVRLQEGDLGRAEADLELGAALAYHPIERSWAVVGLGRIAEARGDREQARARFAAALAAWEGGVPHRYIEHHRDDARRRLEALE